MDKNIGNLLKITIPVGLSILIGFLINHQINQINPWFIASLIFSLWSMLLFFFIKPEEKGMMVTVAFIIIIMFSSTGLFGWINLIKIIPFSIPNWTTYIGFFTGFFSGLITTGYIYSKKPTFKVTPLYKDTGLGITQNQEPNKSKIEQNVSAKVDIAGALTDNKGYPILDEKGNLIKFGTQFDLVDLLRQNNRANEAQEEANLLKRDELVLEATRLLKSRRIVNFPELKMILEQFIGTTEEKPEGKISTNFETTNLGKKSTEESQTQCSPVIGKII